MLPIVKVLRVGEAAPEPAALMDAARMAGVHCDIVDHGDLDEADEGESFEYHLAVTDEANACTVGSRLSRAGSSAHVLVTTQGDPRDETLLLLKDRAADLARQDDLAAIASAMLRTLDWSSGESESREPYRGHLEDLVRKRTRELEESHQQQRLSERMAAMGTLSTGIGHDIGNLVLPLRIGLESLESRNLPGECEQDLQAIRKAVEYLQGLANGLRYLAMDPEDAGLGARHNELSEWWSDVEPLLSNGLPREVRLVRDFPDDLPYVSVPLHHLTQAVFNLVQNAGDAMRRLGAGTVCVRAAAVDGDRGSDGIDTWLQLQVIDDGPGMSAEVQKRCLDPFFTTKYRGVRTGLGLSLVHGIVHRAGGEVHLQSDEGVGTTWTLTLPGKRRTDRQSTGKNPVARVELKDSRMRAYIRSVLQSLDFDVDTDESASRTSLCIIEANSPLAAMATSLLDEDEHLRIVLFGNSPDGTHPRLHEIGSNPASSLIRSTLRDIRAAL